MGTKASLEIYSSDRDSGVRQLETLLEIMERTDAELSTWKVKSNISQLNHSPIGASFTLDRPTCRLFRKIVELHRKTSGAFDPGLGRFLESWGTHDQARVPSSSELVNAGSESGLQHLIFDPRNCVAIRSRNILLDTGAFGKGEALDRALSYSEQADLDPWLINLGGQVAVYGSPPDLAAWPVDLSSPANRFRPYMTVYLQKGSLATSGNLRKTHFDSVTEAVHIIDPRTGRPSLYTGSVTVWHPEALVADALSTACHVMGPEEGIQWATRHQVAVCFLSISDSGRVEIRKNRFFEPLVLR
jgi:thiamine biosynthesis lipoprotein